MAMPSFRRTVLTKVMYSRAKSWPQATLNRPQRRGFPTSALTLYQRANVVPNHSPSEHTVKRQTTLGWRFK